MNSQQKSGLNKDSDEKARSRKNAQQWQHHEIKKIFQLYDEYGSQWNLISNQLPSRTPNSIKNRFYTFLRNLLKGVFRQLFSINYKLPNQIPSIMIRKLYESEQQFLVYKGLIQKIMRGIDFQICVQNLKKIVSEYETQLREIYGLIFAQKKSQQQETELQKKTEVHSSPQMSKQKSLRRTRIIVQNKQMEEQNVQIIEEERPHQFQTVRSQPEREVDQGQQFQIFVFPTSPYWFHYNSINYFHGHNQ